MTVEKRDDYVRHMREAIAQVATYIARMNYAAFVEDKRTQQAVIMNLIIIGEAATRLMADFPDFTHNHPDIPWRSMRGMRNRIAHGYFDIDLALVWETARTALPELETSLARATSV
ncbi:DUF86 domain-containing protein [Asticcacaulis sp. EMRT-3]|uniref:HepT-like ribonuclease domain-containing protein n=1 Tax=Asticcacaulis sp. EMRT-3 TaxID=3040349 RepID=UPI0024AF3AED|nr:DUF86 domain-containing protein [Asticcacaulis sp. EMRT-3]MDI7773976.1 DUF86 domain-containing protein [Asticcacaulis sp. EMRT-3]